MILGRTVWWRLPAAAMTAAAAGPSDAVMTFSSLLQCVKRMHSFGERNITMDLLDQIVFDEYEHQASAKYDAVFVAFYYVYAALTLFGNGFVICLMYRKKELQTPTNFYIASLCLTGWYSLQIFQKREGAVIGTIAIMSEFLKYVKTLANAHELNAFQIYLSLCAPFLPTYYVTTPMRT